MGIRQSYYGAHAGIKPGTYGPGLHFTMAGFERLHLFPNDLQIINFSGSTSEVSQKSRQADSIKIQTSDGYNVQLDVSIIFRVADPYRVFTEAGPGRAFEDRLVIPRADRILRKTLGELNSEEFYQGPKRIEKAHAAHDQLVAEVAPYGIEVKAVLVRAYTYDPKYQEMIEGRKIRDQTVFLRQAEAKAAIEQRKRAAEGKLLVELAEAKGTQLENAALQGAGSENLVGLKMADALRGVRVIVLPSDGKDGTNPLNLGDLLRKFQVK